MKIFVLAVLLCVAFKQYAAHDSERFLSDITQKENDHDELEERYDEDLPLNDAEIDEFASEMDEIQHVNNGIKKKDPKAWWGRRRRRWMRSITSVVRKVSKGVKKVARSCITKCAAYYACLKKAHGNHGCKLLKGRCGCVGKK